MADRTRVASPPARSLVVFDGDCGFCRFWIERWRWRTGGLVDYEPFQQPDILQRFPEIPREHYQAAVHLIEPDGRVTRGAEAAARLLAGAGRPMLLRVYELVPVARALMESAYRAIATHRGIAGRLTTWLWGKDPRPPMYAATSWLFLRLLGVVYLAAFWSLLVQVGGLIGHNGILPADVFMDDVRRFADERGMGLARFHALPTLTWFATSDAFLRGLCLAGLGAAVLLIAGVAEVMAVPFLWLTYLTFSIAGQDFLSFQWDTLLLEAGFLAILLARGFKRARLREAIEPPRVAIWLFLWLVFRLFVGSGAVKLASGDPTWRGLTALTFHFETQPIPTPVGWFAHRLPEWLLKGSTAAVLGIELAVPLLIVFPRRARMAAFIGLVMLQALIALTGNYAFFNLLSAALCLFLLDDATVSRFLRAAPAPRASSARMPVRRVFATAVAIVIVPVSILVFAGSLRFRIPGWPLIVPLASVVEPFRSVNSYGLFAVMTTTRPEIVIEGSSDGVTWLAYEFHYKPGDLRRRPPWVAPHQPRLDWQMWFAALSRFDQERWFGAFCARLLEGSPEVLRLLERDPFQGTAPRYVRGVVYDYHFSTNASRRQHGVWWTRERLRDYSPVLSLDPAGSRK